jgi:hypothetical protein
MGGWVDPGVGTAPQPDKENLVESKGPKCEREVVINFNEAEPYASIWTASEPMYRKLLRLGYEPVEGSDRSATFEVPKRLVSVRKPRKISEAHRTLLADKARLLRKGTIITEAEELNKSH